MTGKYPDHWRMTNRLRIWIASLLLIVLAPAVAIAAVNATHSSNGNHPSTETGTITFTQTGTISGPTERSEHSTVTVVKETLAFSGNLSGSALTIERLVKHNETDDGGTVTFTTFHGSGNFTGTLNGGMVRLHIRYEGVMNSTFARGNFVVSGDTIQNADVHGEGHFRGTLTTNGEGGSPAVNYTMHSHTANPDVQPEASDDDKDKNDE